MDPLLALLQKDARLRAEQLASLLNTTPEEVRARLAAWEADGTILGYQAVTDPEKADDEAVMAMIEVKVTPERGGGFDRIAERIAKFDQVVSCWLMSGGHDLVVVVRGNDLREVARFVAEKLSTLEGVISTATHFQLKVYKQDGFLSRGTTEGRRLAVAP
ncbi:MAG TPA: Lrp/AsnC family transcriptional regulator [Verrucomicrobiales bacterium]|jgi:DNA-binding Lrp family transcriptional regulator|nr:Lrp/AsnC family transcriptional regulator [Verrucomicrobiales bacterium]